MNTVRALSLRIEPIKSKCEEEIQSPLMLSLLNHNSGQSVVVSDLIPARPLTILSGSVCQRLNMSHYLPDFENSKSQEQKSTVLFFQNVLVRRLSIRQNDSFIES